MEKLIRLVANPSMSRIIGQGLVSMCSLVMALSITNYYGAKTFGAYSFIVIIGNLALNILRATFVEPASRLLPKFEAQQRANYCATLTTCILILSLPFTLLIGVAINWLLAIFLNEPGVVSTPIAAAFVLSMVGAELLRAFYQAFASSFRVLAFDILRSVLSIVAIFYIFLQEAYIFTFSNPNLVLASQVVALSFATILAGSFHISSLRNSSLRFRLLYQHVYLAKKSSLIAGVRYFQVNSPLIWGQYLLGEEVLGIVRIWQSLANVITLPANALRLSNITNGARLFEVGGFLELLQHVRLFAIKITVLSLFMLAPMLFIYYILPGKYQLTYDGLIYLCCYVIFNLVANINTAVDTVFYASGQLSPLLVRVVLALIFTITISPILLKYSGGFGVPIAQALTSIFVLIVTINLLIRMKKEIRLRK